MVLPRILVVAGSDSSGGAGLEADQKVIAAHKCYAMTATTALTAQNTLGVRDIHHIPASFVKEQMLACIEDIGVDVMKTGMLASSETIQTIAAVAREHEISSLVVDPVMVSTAGASATLLPHSAIATLIRDLLPLTALLTPNIPEAKLIDLCARTSDFDLQSVDKSVLEHPFGLESAAGLEQLAKRLQSLGPRWVLVKGGHLPLTKDGKVSLTEENSHTAVDVLVGPDGQVHHFESEWARSHNTHGTGCSLASSIASNMGLGKDIPTAVSVARQYVLAGIRNAPKLGRGNGPVDHFHSIQVLPFTPGHFVEFLLEHPRVKPIWTDYVNHPFVMALGDGTLPLQSFKGFIIQDYLFLKCKKQFAKAHALMATKSKTMAEMKDINELVSVILREVQLHIKYCASFGITEEDMETMDEHQACTAYTRFVLDIGHSSTLLALRVAVAPCSLGYGAIAKMLDGRAGTKRRDNPYWGWIETYVADDYTQGMMKASNKIEEAATLESPSRIEELVEVFAHATKMEIRFWEMFPHQ